MTAPTKPAQPPPRPTASPAAAPSSSAAATVAAAATSAAANAAAASSSSSSPRAFGVLHRLFGLDVYSPDRGISPWVWTGAALLFATVFFLLWSSRRKRMEAALSGSANREGSPAYERVVQQQTRLVTSLKEAGNRAYLDREYELAARHFGQAINETMALGRLTHPQLKLTPVSSPRIKSGAVSDELSTESSASSSASSSVVAASDGQVVPSPFDRVYAPPGQLASVANPDLASLPLATANSLAIYFSNRSACLLALNRFHEALADAECAVHCQPLWSKGWLRGGQAYEGLGEFERAESMYLLGAKQDPSDENVARCVTNLRSLQREVAETRRQIERDEKKALRDSQQQLQSSSVSASAAAAASASPRDKFQNLTSWLLRNGASFPYLYLKQYEHDHRGVHTLCRVASGKLLLEVPLRCIVTSDLARRSPVGRALESSGVELASNHTFLACYLLEERARGAASFWEPYLSILPVDYNSMPIFFSESDRRWLKGSFTLPKVAERHRELRGEFERVCSALDPCDLTVGFDDAASIAALSGKFSQRHTLAAFIWARSVVITRIFGFTMNVPAAGAAGSAAAVGRAGVAVASVPTQLYKTDGLVPMADMLNHKRPRDSSWAFDDARQAFVIQSLVPFAARDEVCDSYGRKCNSRFLINYGFCLEGNKEDNQAVVWVKLDSHGEATAAEGAAAATDSPSASASAMPSPSEVQAAATLEKRKRILGIRGTAVDPLLAATQTLSQSASSLSSSSYVLSETSDGSASFSSFYSGSRAGGSGGGALAARVLYPPARSLRFQIPSDFSDKVAREIFSIMRVMVASDDPAQLCLPQPMSSGSANRAGGAGKAREPCTELQAIEILLSHRFASGEGEYHLRSIPPLCVRNELAVLSALRTAALAALAQFETTSEEDDALLEADNKAAEQEAAMDAAAASDSDPSVPRARLPGRLTSTQRNCVLMRRGEKEVLEHYLALGAEALFVVKSFRACRVVAANTAASSAAGAPSAWQMFMQTVVDPRYSSGEGPFDYYLTSVILPLLQQEEEQRAKADEAAKEQQQQQQQQHVHSDSCTH